MTKYLLSFLFLWPGLFATAQTALKTEAISLAEALEKATAHNWQIRESNADIFIAEKNLNRTKAAFLPQVNFAAGGVFTNDPLQAFGIKLKKKDVAAEDFNPDLLNDPDVIGNVFGRIEARQSILQFDQKYKKEALQENITASKYKVSRVTQGVHFEVENTYFQLQLLFKSKDAILKAKELVQEHIRIAKEMVAQDLMLNHDVLRLENRLLELDLQEQQLQSQIIASSDYLCHLVQCETENILFPQDDAPAGFDFETTELSISERADLSAIKAMMRSQEKMQTASKKEFLPQVFAFGAYELNDYATAQNFMLGLQLNWNIYDGGLRTANQEKMQAELLKMQISHDKIKATDKLDIQKNIRAMELAKAQFNLLEKNIQHTKTIQQVTQNRFEQGLAKTTDLLELETQLTNLNLELLKTQYQFHFAKIYLDFVLGKS